MCKKNFVWGRMKLACSKVLWKLWFPIKRHVNYLQWAVKLSETLCHSWWNVSQFFHSYKIFVGFTISSECHVSRRCSELRQNGYRVYKTKLAVTLHEFAVFVQTWNRFTHTQYYIVCLCVFVGLIHRVRTTVKACINKTMYCYGVARQPTIYVWGVATHPRTVGFSWDSCEKNADLKCFVADNIPLMWLFSLSSIYNR